MCRVLFFLLLPIVLIGGDFIKIVANKIEEKDNILTATGDVLISSPKFYAISSKVIYDKNSSTIEFIDDVNIYSNKDLIFVGEYSFIDIKKKFKKIYPVLAIDRKSQIWISGKKSQDINNTIIVNNATISSCECYNPAWTIDFKKGTYKKDKKLLESYYNHFNINGIPVYYFLIPLYFAYDPIHITALLLLTNPPYFRASFDKNRRSGLLKPTLGYGKNDGYFIYQPIYFAPKLNYDIEVIPQFRTIRGKGYELKYRLATSKTAKLEISSGKFFENYKYFKENNLINQQHYGWDLKYIKNNIFKNDKLYIFAQDMNDIEYKNTRYKTKKTSNNLLESKVQYYKNYKNSYLGIRNSYYNDLAKKNNNDTLHTLPEIRFHNFLKKFYFATYNTDIKYQKYYRKVGIRGERGDFQFFTAYDKDFLDNYLHLKLKNIYYLTKINYKNSDYNSSLYQKNKNIISLFSNLFKQYKNIFHNIEFKVEYININNIKQDGELYGINSTKDDIAFFTLNKDANSISYQFSQFFYYNKKKLLYHNMAQSILYNKNGEKKISNLENSLKFFFNNGEVSNSFLYNRKNKTIISKTSSLKYKGFFDIDIDHRWLKDTALASGDDFDYKDLPSLENIVYKIGKKINRFYTISYAEQKDLKKSISAYKEYILDIDKKCWSFNVKLKDSLIATATNDNRAKRQNIYYFTLTLKPIGGIDHIYVEDEREE